MKTNRFWIEMIAIGAMIACALALLIATVATGTAAVAEPSDAEAAAVGSPDPSSSSQSPPSQSSLSQDEMSKSPQQTYEGMVTCSRCGAKHSAKFGKTASDCVRVCVHAGARFSLIEGDKVYQLDGDLNSLKQLAGQRARITGVMHGDTITISSIAAS